MLAGWQINAAASTLVAWGDDALYQTDIPAGLTNVVAIAANGNLDLALNNDGTVVELGNNNPGPSLLSGVSNAVEISAADDEGTLDFTDK